MTDRHDAVVSGQDTGLTSPLRSLGDDGPGAERDSLRVGHPGALSAILERSLNEAIDLRAMEQTTDQQGTWTGRCEQRLVTHWVRVLFTLGGSAARRSVYRACVRAGLADLDGAVIDERQLRVGCLDACESLVTALAPQRSADPGHVVELDRPQVGGMYW